MSWLYWFFNYWIALAKHKRISYHSFEFCWSVFCKNLKLYKLNCWQTGFSWMNFTLSSCWESKNLHSPVIALTTVPLATSYWNSLSKPLLSRIHRFVRSLIDSRIWEVDKFFGKLNSVSIYLTEFPKSIVWFHSLNAFSTVKTNP